MRRSRILAVYVFILLLSGCAIFQKKNINSPLEDFYTSSPLPYQTAANRLVEKARDALNGNNQALAVEHLNKALVIDPYNPFAYFFLSLQTYRNKEFKKSLGFLSKAQYYTKPFPYWQAQTLHLMSLNATALSQHQKAKQYAEKAQKLSPNIDFIDTD